MISFTSARERLNTPGVISARENPGELLAGGSTDPIEDASVLGPKPGRTLIQCRPAEPV